MTTETDIEAPRAAPAPPRTTIGRPPRPVPDNVMALAQRAYNSGLSIFVPIPSGTTPEEVDTFRLDMRAAARRIGGERVIARILGCTAGGTVMSVDRRVKRELWGDLTAVYVRVKRIGVA